MFDAGNTGFLLICTALVFLMTPGLSFFYGGLARRKNVLNTMMSSLFILGVASVMWVAVGYSLSFSGNIGGVIGNLDAAGLNGLKGESPYAPGIPQYAFVAFQMMFAVITPALITGAVAERMKFKALFLFVILWSIVVYYPLAHMVWGKGGFLNEIGSVDFAGGNVVHISSGISGLLLVLFLGKRRGYPAIDSRPHNIPFVLLGAALLWFGWFGFNAGSALGANELAAHALMTTVVSAACALLSWMVIDVARTGKPTVVGAATGMVAGLVAITPGAGFVPVWAAMIIGATVSPICYFAIAFVKRKLRYDDALDAFGCHGIGGIWGGIATGLFAAKEINPAVRWNGLVFGETGLFSAQVLSILITIGVAVAGTLICVGIVKMVTKIRVEEREEKIGLDMAEHGESAYPSFNGMD